MIFMPTLAFYVTPQILGGKEGVMIGTALMPIVKESLNFANGSAFVAPLIAILVVAVTLLRRGINMENLYRSGVGSQQARTVRRKSPGLAIYTVFILLFTYIPMFSLVLISFGKNPLGILPLMGLTLDHYRALFGDSSMVSSLKSSLIIALEVAVITVALCAPAAYAVVRFRFPGRRSFLFLSLLPMLIPELILGIAILTLLVTSTITLSLQTIVLGHVTLAVPFVFLTILAQQYGYDRTVEEASKDLGASPLTTFIRVVLPLMVPGIIAATFLAITISFNDFVISFLLTGGDSTLPLYIFGMSKGGVSPDTNALGVLLLAAVVALILLRLLQPWAWGMLARAIRRGGGQIRRVIGPQVRTSMESGA